LTNLSFSKLFDPAILRDIKSNSPPLLRIRRITGTGCQRHSNQIVVTKAAWPNSDLRVKNKATGFLKNYSTSSNIPGGKLAV
jgi:hypothetical protein